MLPKALNTVGMVGVAILFQFGPPQPHLETGISIVLEDANPMPGGRTVADHNQDILKLRRGGTMSGGRSALRSWVSAFCVVQRVLA